ncbi:hypothetical protein BKI52_02185 [marine bacterium AO1-C]|nr:hypothetical protein BKI52_02185 [marine bacterium AO1-C]
MNNPNNIALEDFGWQVLRTPLYPATLGNQEHFLKILKTDLFQQAIYLSSTSLYHSLKKLLEDKLSEKEKKRTTQSLFSYFLRASYRCTPFGLMAGLALGNITEQTKIMLEGIKRHNRIDAEVLYLLRNSQLASPDKLYHPNPTLYKYDQNTQRYFYRSIDHNLNQQYNYQFQYSSVEVNQYLDLLFSNPAARPKEAYIQQLVEEDIDYESALEFIQDLIDVQLLQDSFQISPVGKELQERLCSGSTTGQILLDKVRQATSVSDYQIIEKEVQNTDPSLDIDKHVRNLFHVDTERKTQYNSLDRAQVGKITQVIKTLYQVIPAKFGSSLTQFCHEFNQRYENQQVSLMEVIDPENGILYPSGMALKQPYIFNNLGFPQEVSNPRITLDKWQNFLFKIYSQSVLGKKIIKLSSKELLDEFGNVNSEHHQYPETIGALVSILGQNKMQLKGSYAGAGTYLGRFALMNPELEQAVQQVTDYEQSTNPEVIYAEIVHAPTHPKTYNILNRPANIRHYKLVLFANPTIYPSEEVILPKDLLVSVTNNEIVLHHAPSGKRILPFLTTAHNQRGSNFPAYNFLSDLTYQHTYLSNWRWGALTQCVFLPRVEIDDVVVAPAIWKIKQIKDLDTFNIPEKFWLTMGDRKLMIDQNCELSQNILQDKLSKGKQEIIVEEYLFEDYVIKDKQAQGYTNEVVIPLKVTNPRKLKLDFKYQLPLKHFLGDSWVYFKIYCGTSTANALLKNQIPQIIQYLGANVEKWFFIRYKDSQGDHLRIRIKLHQFTPTVFISIKKPLEYHLQKGLIRISFDTYEPEVQRYGGLESLDLCESIFFEDSNTILKALTFLEQDKDQEEEMYLISLAMKNIDYLLKDFGLNLKQRLNFATQGAQALANELNTDNAFKKRLGKTYRNYQKNFTAIGSDYDKIFKVRSANLQLLIQQIKKLARQAQNEKELTTLFYSLTHMSLNRLFNQLPRQQEYITWDFLVQYYKTEMYRSNN